jgi:hypothetical protein
VDCTAQSGRTRIEKPEFTTALAFETSAIKSHTVCASRNWGVFACSTEIKFPTQPRHLSQATCLLNKSSAGNRYRIASLVLALEKLRGLPGMDGMDNAEFQPFLFVDALEAPNISDSEKNVIAAPLFCAALA